VGLRQEIPVTQPQNNMLYVKVAEKDTYYYNTWFDFDGNVNLKKDTLFLNTVKVNVEKSKDGAFHAHMMLISKGNDNDDAEQRAQKISFPIIQQDSMLVLPSQFAITKDDKWRNQKIIVVIEVPEGSYIQLDENINEYDYFNIEFNRRHRNGDWDFDWENETRYIKKGVPLQMNQGKLEREEENVNDDEQYEYQQDENELKKDSTEETAPAIEKKEETIYRYSMNSNTSAPALISRLRVKTNPLNAMLRF
jgi:hypothetical protein